MRSLMWASATGRPRTVSRTAPEKPSSAGRRRVETSPGLAATRPPSAAASLVGWAAASAGGVGRRSRRHGLARAVKKPPAAHAVATNAAIVYDTGTGWGAE